MRGVASSRHEWRTWQWHVKSEGTGNFHLPSIFKLGRVTKATSSFAAVQLQRCKQDGNTKVNTPLLNMHLIKRVKLVNLDQKATWSYRQDWSPMTAVTVCWVLGLVVFPQRWIKTFPVCGHGVKDVVSCHEKTSLQSCNWGAPCKHTTLFFELK